MLKYSNVLHQKERKKTHERNTMMRIHMVCKVGESWFEPSAISYQLDAPGWPTPSSETGVTEEGAGQWPVEGRTSWWDVYPRCPACTAVRHL